MSLYARIISLQFVRDQTRAMLYYHGDAWHYVSSGHEATDDRVHRNTWRRFSPRSVERGQRVERQIAMRVQRGVGPSPVVVKGTGLHRGMERRFFEEDR
jgi:hypothetical protein